MRYTEQVPVKVLERAASDIYFKPTNTALARMFGVSYETILYWKRTHKKFVEAIDGAFEIVSDNVEDTQLKRAHGYDYVETRDEVGDDGTTKRVTTHKHMPADPSMLKYFLNNRRSSEWSDKQEINQTGSGVVTVFLKESQKEEL